MNLTCPVDKKISVKYAMYGRVSKLKCINFDFTRYSDKCMSNVKETIEIVKSMCESKNFCKLKPSPVIYGNPCEGINKYLEVKYVCV